MTADASERLRRLLGVLPLFADMEEVTLAELKKRAGVDAKTLLEDLRAITDRSGDPGGFVESINVIFGRDSVAVRSPQFQRPVRITLPELCALELGLAMVGATTPPDERAPVERARARLREMIVAMPAVERNDLWQSAPPELADPEHVSSIRDAARRRRKARIGYRGGSDTAAVERTIHPYALMPTHGTWFIVAHCERSAGLRFFRADRMESVRVMEDAFTRPDDLAVDELLAAGKPFSAAAPDRLVIRYSPKIARWIAEREKGMPGEDGSYIVEHPLADVQWGVRHVLQYGPDAEVIAPASVREEVRRVLRAIVEGDMS